MLALARIGAILISIIAFGASSEHGKAFGVKRHFIFESIGCSVRIIKCVLVFKYAPYIKRPCSSFHLSDGFLTKRITPLFNSNYTSGGAKGCVATLRYGRRQVILLERTKELKASTPFYAIGRGFSKVLGYKRYNGTLGKFGRFNCSLVYMNIGPQLSSCSIIGSLYQLAGDLPQFPSYAAKNNSGNAHNNGKNRDYALTVNPLPTAAPYKRAPFLPVFICGALTYFAAMFASIYIYNRSDRLTGNPKRKWRLRLLRTVAFLIAGIGSFSFALGFPWTAFF